MEGTRRPLKSMCARTQSCVYFIFWPEFSLQVASSTWTTNMLRLDPTFNADLPESKRWLKEYGARENEAFRYTGFFLYSTSHWATFYEGYKTCVILLLLAQPLHWRKYPVPAKEGDRRRALENATKFLVVRHPLDRLVSSYLDKVPFSVKIIYWSQCVFVFAWLLVRLVFVLSCSKSKYNMIDWWLGFCDSKSFQGGRHDKGAEPAEAPRRKERNPGSGGKKFQGGRGAGHNSDHLTLCGLWPSSQETFAGAHFFRVRWLRCKRDDRTPKSKRLEGDELLIQNKGLSKK